MLAAEDSLLRNSGRFAPSGPSHCLLRPSRGLYPAGPSPYTRPGVDKSAGGSLCRRSFVRTAQATYVIGAGLVLGPGLAPTERTECRNPWQAPHLKSSQHRLEGGPAPLVPGTCSVRDGNLHHMKRADALETNIHQKRDPRRSLFVLGGWLKH